MLGKNRIKTIRSLEHKKYRQRENLFLAEGSKLVSSLLASGTEVELLAGTPESLDLLGPLCDAATLVVEAAPGELARATFLKSPPSCIALCRLPGVSLSAVSPERELVLCLDGIQDPGNLGTIVRLAAWFGIHDLVCSEESADLYSPKAVQATMGALANVRVHYTPLEEFFGNAREKQVPVMGTFLAGENIYHADLTPAGILVVGSEGQGIRQELLPWFSQKLTIPGFAAEGVKPESLNVSVATAIVLSEFRRRKE